VRHAQFAPFRNLHGACNKPQSTVERLVANKLLLFGEKDVEVSLTELGAIVSVEFLMEAVLVMPPSLDLLRSRSNIARQKLVSS